MAYNLWMLNILEILQNSFYKIANKAKEAYELLFNLDDSANYILYYACLVYIYIYIYIYRFSKLYVGNIIKIIH